MFTETTSGNGNPARPLTEAEQVRELAAAIRRGIPLVKDIHWYTSLRVAFHNYDWAGPCGCVLTTAGYGFGVTGEKAYHLARQRFPAIEGIIDDAERSYESTHKSREAIADDLDRLAAEMEQVTA